MDRTNQLAQRLHELQFDRRMTQAQFSREIGLPRSTLQSIMTDGNTTVDTLIRIANALEVSLDELVFGSPPPLPARERQLLHAFEQYSKLSVGEREGFMLHFHAIMDLLGAAN